MPRRLRALLIAILSLVDAANFLRVLSVFQEACAVLGSTKPLKWLRILRRVVFIVQYYTPAF